MPLYGFRCDACEATFDLRRLFSASDDPAPCPRCGSGATRKVLGTPFAFARSSGAELMLAALTTAAKPLPPHLRHGDGCPCARCRGPQHGESPQPETGERDQRWEKER